MKALLFGSIGVIAETSEVQRQCYNRALSEYRTGLYWNTATYCHLIRTPGGLLRLERLGVAPETAQKVHLRKQELFLSELEGISPRDGITRLISECHEKNIELGFITTTTRQTLDGMMAALSDHIDFSQFSLITCAGDVASPKPASDIYHHALSRLNRSAEDVFAIEDTEMNLAAAQNAGLKAGLFAGDYATLSGQIPQISNISLTACQAVLRTDDAARQQDRDALQSVA